MTFRRWLRTSCRSTAGGIGVQIDGFETAALQQMLSHTWPGNVRELDHTMERAVLMARGARIAAADLGLQPVRGSARA